MRTQRQSMVLASEVGKAIEKVGAGHLARGKSRAARMQGRLGGQQLPQRSQEAVSGYQGGKRKAESQVGPASLSEACSLHSH